jgi:hypothetical protein
LEWQDNSNSTEGFEIEISRNSPSDFSKFATVYKPQVTYRDSIINFSGVCYFKVRAFNALGYGNYSNIASIILSSNEMISYPSNFFLFQNYPNPFNPTTVIKFHIPLRQLTDEFITLKVYDILGREVATLVEEEKPPGSYEAQFSIDKLRLSSGVYIYRLTAGDFVKPSLP